MGMRCASVRRVHAAQGAQLWLEHKRRRGVRLTVYLQAAVSRLRNESLGSSGRLGVWGLGQQAGSAA